MLYARPKGANVAPGEKLVEKSQGLIDPKRKQLELGGTEAREKCAGDLTTKVGPRERRRPKK